MKAIVVKPFAGAPDGEVYATNFQRDDVIEGRLASVAIAQGWAVPEDGEMPVDPEVRRSEVEAELKEIDAELEKRRNEAALEIEQINKGVSDARSASDTTLADIADTVLKTRNEADTELANIASEVTAAKEAAAAEIKKLEVKPAANVSENDSAKTKTKADKE